MTFIDKESPSNQIITNNGKNSNSEGMLLYQLMPLQHWYSNKTPTRTKFSKDKKGIIMFFQHFVIWMILNNKLGFFI